MDTVVVLENGRLVSHGLYEEVEKEAASLLRNAEHEIGRISQSKEEREEFRNSLEREAVASTHESVASPSNLLNVQRSNGSWGVYSYYAKSAGTLSIVLMALFTLTSSVTTSYMSRLSPDYSLPTFDF